MADRRKKFINEMAARYNRVVVNGGKHVKLVDPEGVRRVVGTSVSPKNVDLWKRELKRDLERAEREVT